MYVNSAGKASVQVRRLKKNRTENADGSNKGRDIAELGDSGTDDISE